MRLILAALALTSTIASAQAGMAGTPPSAPPAASVATEVQKSYAAQKKNILASADKMPADQYGFKPHPDVRVYARIINHVTEAQTRVCGAVNGTPAASLPKVPADTATKAEVIDGLKASFAECDKAYASVSTSNVLDPIQIGPMGTRTRIGALWGNVSHDNEQYAQLALYLRAKDLVPPTSEK